MDRKDLGKISVRLNGNTLNIIPEVLIVSYGQQIVIEWHPPQHHHMLERFMPPRSNFYNLRVVFPEGSPFDGSDFSFQETYPSVEKIIMPLGEVRNKKGKHKYDVKLQTPFQSLDVDPWIIVE